MKRKSLSKRARFDVFKRDGFTCQYCGSTPPAVVLEVDHIDPVAAGGGDDETNLITACFDCNRGKSANSLDVAPEALTARAARIAEAEEQLMAYRQLVEAVEERKASDAWEVLEELFGKVESVPRARYSSVRGFLEKLILDEVMEAARIARDRKPYSDPQRFSYFGGVCWNKIRGPDR